MLDFIPQDKYDKLDDEVREKLLDYRRSYSNIMRKEKKIENLSNEIKRQKQLLSEMKMDLTSKNSFIDHLRETFYFTCSVVSFQKGKYRYYNITISRRSGDPKNCSLGREETIKNHLLNYYKGNPKVLKEIKSNWKEYLKVELNYGETFNKILDMILENPLGFRETIINRHTLFPLE